MRVISLGIRLHLRSRFRWFSGMLNRKTENHCMCILVQCFIHKHGQEQLMKQNSFVSSISF